MLYSVESIFRYQATIVWRLVLSHFWENDGHNEYEVLRNFIFSLEIIPHRIGTSLRMGCSAVDGVTLGKMKPTGSHLCIIMVLYHHIIQHFQTISCIIVPKKTLVSQRSVRFQSISIWTQPPISIYVILSSSLLWYLEKCLILKIMLKIQVCTQAKIGWNASHATCLQSWYCK